MPPVDPNEVMMTGENSFIRLSPDGGKTLSDRASHWRVLWCPAGGGHVAVPAEHAHRRRREDLQRQHRGGAVAPEVDRVPALPGLRRHVPARDVGELRAGRWALVDRHRVGGHRRHGDHAVLVRLHRAVRAPCASRASMTGRSACSARFFPARGAQLEIDGRVATGSVWAEMRGDRQGSSASSRGRRRGSSPGSSRAPMKYFEDVRVGEMAVLGSSTDERGGDPGVRPQVRPPAVPHGPRGRAAVASSAA